MNDSGGRRAGQRSGRPDRPAVRGSRDRPLPAGRHRRSPSPLTMHAGALQTNYVSDDRQPCRRGRRCRARRRRTAWFFLSRVEVAGAGAGRRDRRVRRFDHRRHALDGRHQQPLAGSPGAAAAGAASIKMGVLNAGIGGNRVLGDGAGVNALARFDRDVLDADRRHARHRARGHQRHRSARARTPDAERRRHHRRPSPADRAGARARPEDLRRDADAVRGRRLLHAGRRGEAPGAQRLDPDRQAYDGVIDFDKAMRDPNARRSCSPAFDSGDHLHPSDAGYQAMGDAIDLALFK